MSVRCQSFLAALEQWAPLHYAEEWDNVGLQVGDRQKEIQKVMVALTPSQGAIAAAVHQGVDLLLTHHPLIFKAMKQVTTDSAAGRAVRTLIQHDVNLYCAHTNLDIAQGGVNDQLAQALGLQQVQPLADLTTEVVAGTPVVRGIGRIGRLPEPVTLGTLLELVGSRLGCTHLSYHGNLEQTVQQVALCGGSGMSYLQAAQQAGAQVYITGDVKYHDGQAAEELGISVIDASHYHSEKLIVQALADFVRRQGLEAVVYQEADFLQHFWTGQTK